jgi:hypothetical protein
MRVRKNLQVRHGKGSNKQGAIMRAIISVAFVVGSGLLLAACASQPASLAAELPGFWSGLLHGAIAPFSLLGGIFSDIRVFAFPNSGWWYDFGFMLGITIVWGGGPATVYRNRTIVYRY